jgi:hypothetical protein
MELPLYQIVDWDYFFENAKSRSYQKPQFVCVPNKHGGTGLSNLQGHPDGAAIYGVWMWTVQICSRQPPKREGWLTSDGKKDGRRLRARELANMFRRPIEEIHRMFQVTTSPEVAFVKLVSGHPEFMAQYQPDTSGIPDGYQTDTTVSESDTSGILAGYHDIPLMVTEGRKEGMNEGRESAESNLSQKRESEEEKSDPSGIPDGYQTDTTVSDGEAIQHAEAKILLTSLCKDVFPKEVRYLRGSLWPDDWTHLLDDALPLPRRDWELIAWAYRQPASDRIHEVTMLKQSFDALMKNLRSEPQKIESARKRLGLNGLNPLSAEPKPEPPGWREIAEKEYEGVPLPESFWQLSETARRRVVELQGATA